MSVEQSPTIVSERRLTLPDDEGGAALKLKSRGAKSRYYRPLILGAAALTLLALFWFASRYPQLLAKAEHVGNSLPSMAYSSEVIPSSPDDPVWRKVFAATVNWLDGMKIGMTFGVLFGALLHTTLHYYPLRIGRNLFLNSIKGAVLGVPMGVCANCAVPTACGITRGHGRVEVALGFLFSSPNFNPVVVAMSIAALPLAMVVTKYALLLVVILVVVPGIIGWIERRKPSAPGSLGSLDAACALPDSRSGVAETFGSVARELSVRFGESCWMLVKPTIALMLLASVVSALILVLLPWESLLSEPTPVRLGLASVISVFLPVPIALDVMFAAQLQQQGAAGGYVMLFATTLGTYSIIPSVYLWREVSRTLSVSLFAFFVGAGWLIALLF
jgi:uncharacterized membrane protein YraQ (UPF0718 family)